MENQPIVPNQPVLEMPEMKKNHTLLTVIISVVVTAAIVGGGVYFWQNMESKEAEVTSPEVTPIQTATIKPTITSPQGGTTIENALDGVKITGKAAPGSTVWLVGVGEMDPFCFPLADMLTLGDKVDASGNFELTYKPTGDPGNWFNLFGVVSLDENQKYQLNWVNGTFCAPDEAKSDYFQLNLKTPSNILFQDDTYRFRVIATAKECADYYDFKVKTTDIPKGALKAYSIFVPGSESWPQNLSSGLDAIYTQEAYDKLSSDDMQIKPRIIFDLGDGKVIVKWDPQDSPPDMPQNCHLNFEKF